MTYRPKTLSDIEKFHDLRIVPVVHVPGSSVTMLDEELLKRDFPFLAPYKTEQLKKWIVDNFSYISVAQHGLTGLRNTPIPTDSEPIAAYRHRAQGRGDYMTVRDFEGGSAGFIDRKGTGITDERAVVKNRRLRRFFELAGALDRFEKRAMTNGLQLLDYALVETLFTQAAQLQFERHRAQIDQRLGTPQTIGVYFVMRFPFDILRGPDGTTPAGLMARQAHVGRVWVGTNPVRGLTSDTNTVKQTDYFLSFVDLETTRLKDVQDMPALFKKYDRVKATDVAKEIKKGNLTGKEILDALADVNQKLNALRPVLPPEISLAEAYQKVLDHILCSPTDYSCLAESILDFQRRGLTEFTLHPRTRDVIRLFLSMPEDKTEKWAMTLAPVRRWGLLLIPSLPLDEALQVIRREVSENRPTLTSLALTFWMMPFEKVQEFLPGLATREPAAICTSLRNRLREASVAKDSRYGNYLLFFDFLLRFPATRVLARRHLQFLSVKRRADLHAVAAKSI